jgi:cell division topological specificity factor
MTDFIERIFGKNRKSANQAKERLHLVLVHDRTNLTNSALEELKDELIDVISRHIDIDPNAVIIEMSKEGRQQRLIADIPIKGPKRQRGR